MKPPAEESVSGGKPQDVQLALSSVGALHGGRTLWRMIGGLQRERHERASRLAARYEGPDAVEAEVLSILYGDARARHRAYDTQPSHIRHVSAASGSSGAP